MKIETTGIIHATPEIVWRALTEFSTWAKWNPNIEIIEPIGESAALIKQKGLQKMMWTVEELIQERSFIWNSGRGPVLHFRAQHTLDVTADGTKVTLILEVKGALRFFLGPLIKKNSAHALENELRGLRHYCEVEAKSPGIDK